MIARKILTVFFVGFVLAEAKWSKQKRAVSTICDATYKRPGKIMCYCLKEVKQPEVVKSAECYLISEGVKQDDDVWKSLDALKSTTKLTFSNTRDIPLEYVPTHALVFLDGLLEMSIKQANIVIVHPFAFANSSNVEDISLRGNQIRILQKYAFAHHRDLTVIKLDKNNIEEIDRDVFVDLPFIEKLFLTDNVITTIHDGAFAHLGTLRELEINMNKLYSLNSDTFKGLNKLLKLDLSSNNLQVIGDNTFSPLSSLQSLNLDENKIQILDKYAFSGLNNLQHLSLAHNQISDINNDLLFVELKSLRTLNLRGNGLKQLKASLLQPLLQNFYESGSYLDVEDNLFPCNCELDWFLALMNRTSSKTLKLRLENIKCVPDSTLMDKWKKLEEADKPTTPNEDSEETLPSGEYEYYDESQLNGNLFYTDIRDLINCGKNSSQNNAIDRTFTHTTSKTSEKVPRVNNQPKSEITTTTPIISNNNLTDTNDTEYRNRDTKRYVILNSGLLDLSQYENKSNEQPEGMNSFKTSSDYSTAHLKSLPAKAIEKNSVYEDMAADEAKPDSSNAPTDGEGHTSSAPQNVVCVSLISLICAILFH